MNLLFDRFAESTSAITKLHYISSWKKILDVLEVSYFAKLNGQGSVSVRSDLHFLMIDEEIYLWGDTPFVIFKFWVVLVFRILDSLDSLFEDLFNWGNQFWLIFIFRLSFILSTFCSKEIYGYYINNQHIGQNLAEKPFDTIKYSIAMSYNGWQCYQYF